jgi:N-acylneuraminate cytidylyltransferase
MPTNMKTLAIIPARGGSKRIPRKNIKLFLGKPIINYSIEVALQSNCFDEVMVSTDDNEIADVAKAAGAKVPFMRSKENSNDMAMTAPVLVEVVNKYKEIGKNFDIVCCIYPTAPFITPTKLQTAFKSLTNSGASCVLPVVRFSYPIQRSLKIINDRASMFWPENYDKRSQDLEPAYHDCGQFYFLTIDSLLKEKSLFPEFTLPMEIPETEVQDIDNETDWQIGELKYKFLHDI